MLCSCMSVFVPDPGMSLGLGVMVRTVTENGIAANYGVKLGDEIYQVCTHPHTITIAHHTITPSHHHTIIPSHLTPSPSHHHTITPHNTYHHSHTSTPSHTTTPSPPSPPQPSQVNRINLAADNPLQFAQCLLSAAQTVTLSIKRQVSNHTLCVYLLSPLSQTL